MIEDVKTTLKWIAAATVLMAILIGGSAVAGLAFWAALSFIMFVVVVYGNTRTERLERERKAAKKAKKKLRKSVASA